MGEWRRGGGTRQFFASMNCLFVSYLGCIPSFNVLLCLELVKKFVVGGWLVGGGGCLNLL